MLARPLPKVYVIADKISRECLGGWNDASQNWMFHAMQDIFWPIPGVINWGNREMGTAISCTESSQVAGLIQKVGKSSSKACIMIDT